MILVSFYLSLKLLAIYMSGVFILSLIKKDNSLVDTAYGLGFILVILSTLFTYSEFSFLQILISSLITLWALRLSARIYLRNKNKPEDFRYKKWRDEWKWFKTRSFFQIYVLQGAIILCISSLGIFVNGSLGTSSILNSPLPIFCIVIGIIIWATGFFFEAVGDSELDRFIKKQSEIKAKGEIPQTTIMTEGLWGITRHPNYFGEVSMWWGLWVISLPVIFSNPLGFLTILSPLTITYLLLKVSGIPMLEEKYKGNKEYEEYQKRVNAFWPGRKD